MKQYGKSIMIGAFCTVLLTGCTITIDTKVPNSEISSASNSQVESSTDNSELSVAPTNSPSSSQQQNDLGEQDTNTSASIAQKEDLELLQYAITLTEHLVDYSFPYHADKGFSTPEDLVKAGDGLAIYRFMYAQYKYFDEPTDPYYGLFDSAKLKTDITAVVPLKDAQQIAAEVFGVDSWPETKNLDGFDQEAQCFNFALETGGYSMYTARNISAEQADSQTITVTFDLLDSNSAAKNHGKYKITYQILTDGDREFLRFKSCLPC